MMRSELLELVYRFYPRGMHECSLGYENTEERYRRREAARRGAAEYPAWRAMLGRLGERYTVVDHALCLLAGTCVVAYSGYVLLSDAWKTDSGPYRSGSRDDVEPPDGPGTDTTDVGDDTHYSHR